METAAGSAGCDRVVSEERRRSAGKRCGGGSGAARQRRWSNLLCRKNLFGVTDGTGRYRAEDLAIDAVQVAGAGLERSFARFLRRRGRAVRVRKRMRKRDLLPEEQQNGKNDLQK